MKFREHRGGFEDSMSTTVEVSDRAALMAHFRKLAEPWPTFPPITDDTVHIESYYGIDERNGWDTHIVTLDGYGVLGFTDGPVE
jgi:hypothetical protein